MEGEDNAPPKITFNSELSDLSMHPCASVVATAEVDGRVSLWKYGASSDEGNTVIASLTHHKDSCRAVAFSNDGQYLFTGSLDMSMSVVDLNTGKVQVQLPNVHSAGISCLGMLSEALVASGDDDGTIKIWDMRTQSKVKEFKECEDYISDMFLMPGSNTLLATSGDGSLSAYDVAAKSMLAVSDYMEEELLSLCPIKALINQSKVVCGTQDGVLCVFTYGMWADCTDRVPGHPNSVETIVKLDEDTIITGSSDGLIRIMQMYPNKLLGVVGDHDDFPIEKIALSHDRALLASCSHDQTVQFWDVAFLTEDDGEEDDDMEEDGGDDSGAEPAPKGLMGGQKKGEASFFDDL